MKAKSRNSVSAYARERGESFTRNVHPRRAKAGTFLDLVGEKCEKVDRCFRFASSSFELQSIVISRWRIVGRKSACDTGKGLRFGPWDAGATRIARRGENTVRSAVVKRGALSRCKFVRFYAFS